MGKKHDEELEALQLALVQTQTAALVSGQRTVLILEGRDGAGKDGTIKASSRISARARPVSCRCPSRPIASGRPGISSAMWRIFQRRASS